MTTCGSGAGAGVGSLAHAIAPSARHSARPGIVIQARRKFSCIWMYLRHGRFVDRFTMRLWSCKTCIMGPTVSILHILIYCVKYSIVRFALPRKPPIITGWDAQLIRPTYPGCRFHVSSALPVLACTFPASYCHTPPAAARAITLMPPRPPAHQLHHRLSAVSPPAPVLLPRQPVDCSLGRKTADQFTQSGTKISR